MRRLRWALEPAIGVALLWVWLASYARPVDLNEIGPRSDMQVTNIYAVLLAATFAFAIAISRALPLYSVGLVAAALATQLLGWASRFSQTGWSAYLMLLPLTALLAIHAVGRARRIAMIGAAPIWIVVSVLLTVPFFSLSGTWGLLNGKPATSPEVWTGLVIYAAVPLLLSTVIWRAATRLAARRPADYADDDLERLSQRERDVYAWVANGMTNREIAGVAHIEESTVKTHVSNILDKLDLTNRTAIVAHAYRTGQLDAHHVAPATSPHRIAAITRRGRAQRGRVP